LIAIGPAFAGEEGLLLYYPCDEGSGTVLKDHGPYQRDGSLNSATNAEARGVTIVCGKAGEWVPICTEDGVQRKGIVPGSDSALAEGERPIVLDRDKDYAIDYVGGRIKAIDGGRGELGKPFTLDFKYANPGPQWVQGRRGGGLKLDGVDDFVILGVPGEMDQPTSFTMELWILPPKEVFLDWVILRQEPGIGERITTPRGIRPHPPKAKLLTREKWHHVAVACKDGLIRYFLDGKDMWMRYRDEVKDPLRRYSVGGARDPLFLGAVVDEIKIYNRAKTAEEIAKDAAP